MRAKVTAIVLALGLAGAIAVVAAAQTAANGLPAYTKGYAKWPKLNRKPLTAPGAHTGVKNVYASKKRGAKGVFPNGAVVVKTIVKPGTGYVGQVAVMRKLRGKWRYIEWDRSSAKGRYTVLARGQLCQSCHMQARKTDYVFTTR